MIMRQGLLWLSERQGVFNFVRRNGSPGASPSRFVAGESIEQGVEAARELSRRGITASLDLLGESVAVEAEAVAGAGPVPAACSTGWPRAAPRSTCRSS